MNLNVKLEGEEEQTIQYVNRFAINIPPTTFNLNLVNSGLNNQGYILNPVNSVGQNIVAFQPPMAVQSYFTLPAESEGNIIHGLPVGVSVPVGLPVQTGFIQNNFINTNFIIGNENCNSNEIVESAQDPVDQDPDVKPTFLTKPLDELDSPGDTHDKGANCSPNLNLYNAGKKLCPLEMSIKAANIDIEFEKCEPGIPILVHNSLGINDMKLNDNLLNTGNENLMKIELSEPVLVEQTPNVNLNLNKIKTEITWDSSCVKNERSSGNFQESLICEVEEVNDDEGDDEETIGAINDIQADIKGETDSSSEESDGLPLSIALNIKKFPNSDNKKMSKNEKVRNSKTLKLEVKKSRKEEQESDEDEDEDEDSREDEESESEDGDWSESDDDVLNLKRIKNNKQTISKAEDISKTFVRIRSCCSKKECSKKISVKDQMAVHKHFYELESDYKRESYLINCIEHVQKIRNTPYKGPKEKNDNYLSELGEKDALVVNPNIQLEIENESNGNQKLSDEIQNAINESLKDCGVQLNESCKIGRPFTTEDLPGGDKEEKNNWNYYIVIDRCRKKVCLQFLLKLLRLTKNRIKQLQKKILAGTPLVEETNMDHIWDTAKLHLESLAHVKPLNCEAHPGHLFLLQNYTREEMFANFKAFYHEKNGKDPNLKFAAYKRFLDKDTSVSFLQMTNESCAECEDLKRRKKTNKNVKSHKMRSEDDKMKKNKNDTDDTDSDNESSTKCKRIKLTIPLKGITNSNKMPQKKQNSKSKSVDKKTKLQKERNRHSATRGRDVWSLMLLHLETMPYKECKSCTNKKKHRFLGSTYTTQGLFEDYRKYFLKETNSELGLGFTMYEKYFNRNCNYTLMDLNADETRCPRCAIDQ
ncbi:hypothetical protein RUM43_001661 [Polyplax serrata]|uniref:Uncharacterized protein n=1 Tax=Polyplax serrata TaxID=468196 RepID=A0AAN8XR44_POLSC